MNYLAFTIGGSTINPPANIPQGGLNTLETIIQNGFMLFLFAGTALCLIYIVWGGVQWAGSGGDKSKVSGARGKVTLAITGFIVAIVAILIATPTTVIVFGGASPIKITCETSFS